MYEVRKDETLSGIAASVTGRMANWMAIGKVNRIENDRTIPVGTKLLIPARLLPATPTTARVIATSGKVLIQKRNGAQASASVGDMVGEGDKLLTLESGFLSLGLGDGTRIMFRPDTSAELGRLRTTRHLSKSTTQIRLERGAVESQVTPAGGNQRPSYEVVSPKAVSSVRGTAFRVRVDAQRAVNETVSGTVAVGGRAGGGALREQRLIGKGFGTIVENGRVGVPMALLEAPVLGDGYTVQERLPVQFFLQRDGAAALQATVSRDASGLDVVNAVSAAAGKGAATLRLPDLADGAYFLHFSAIDAAGLQGMPGAAPFRVKARPFPPLLLQRQDRFQGGEPGRESAVLLEWARLEGMSGYRLQVAADAGFASPIIDRSVGGDVVTWEAKLPAGAYFWRVASLASRDGKPDQGPFGDARRLDVLDAQAAPTVEPSDAGMRFHWSGGPGQSYEFQLAASAAFDKPLVASKVDAPSALVPDLAPGTYYARVRSLHHDGFVGTFSPPQAFEVTLRWRSTYGDAWQAGAKPVDAGFKH